jgi:hypothetical protein
MDPNIGILDTVKPPIKNKNNPQRSPFRHPTPVLQNDIDLHNTFFFCSSSSLCNDSLHESSASSLDITVHHIGYENPHFLSYHSNITLDSVGEMYNASFTTSPGYVSSINLLNTSHIGPNHDPWLRGGLETLVGTGKRSGRGEVLLPYPSSE